MKVTKFAIPLVCLLAVTLFAACSSSSSRVRYPVASSGIAQKLDKGTVTETRAVVIDGKATGLGAIVGGGIGAGLGTLAVPERQSIKQTRSVNRKTGELSEGIRVSSNSNEQRAAGLIGGAVGAVVGQRVEKALTAKKAQEITIEMDSGEVVVVVQQKREPLFFPNERVQVYTTRAGHSQVFHIDEDPFTDPDVSAYIVDETSSELPPVTW